MDTKCPLLKPPVDIRCIASLFAVQLLVGLSTLAPALPG